MSDEGYDAGPWDKDHPAPTSSPATDDIKDQPITLNGMKLADDEILVLNIQGPDIDADMIQNIRTSLRRELGEGRVLILGSDDETTVQMATIKQPPSTLAVKVSGAEIYKAVKNYIKSNEVIHAKVKEAVEETIKKGAVQNQLDQIVKQHFTGWGSEKKLTELMKQVISDDFRKRVDAEIASAVEKVLERAVFVMPPKDKQT